MKTLLSAIILFSSFSVLAHNPKVSCVADYSLVGMEAITVELTEGTQGIRSKLNGEILNENVQSNTYAIRSDLDLTINIFKDEPIPVNQGEFYLLSIASQESGIQSPIDEEESMSFPTGINFNLKDVRSVKVYDLQENNDDMFGGTQLIEAFDENDALLGRVARIMVFQACN